MQPHGEQVSSKRISDEEKRIAGFGSVVMMNLAIMVAGCSSGWNHALSIGVWEFLISLVLCTLAYLCLTLCVAEMAGIIAFSGGSYGYVRCTLSPLIGFYCGICDLLQTVFYTAMFVQVVAEALAISTGQRNYEPLLPLWYLAVYALIIALALPGGRWFWLCGAVTALLSIAMLLYYCLMNVERVDFPLWATQSSIAGFAGSPGEFFATLQVPMLCYVGVDLITLFGDEAQDPQRNIPRAMLLSLAITICLAFWVILTALSTHPGVSSEFIGREIVFPMHFGFEDLYGLSNAAGNLLMAPITFSSAVGFMFAAGRQIFVFFLSLSPRPFISC